MEEGVVPAEEDCQFYAAFTVLESIALEELVVREDLPAYQVGVLLEPLLKDLDWVLLASLVEQSVTHDIIQCQKPSTIFVPSNHKPPKRPSLAFVLL